VNELHERIVRNAEYLISEILGNTCQETKCLLYVCRATNCGHIEIYCAHKFCEVQCLKLYRFLQYTSCLKIYNILLYFCLRPKTVYIVTLDSVLKLYTREPFA